MASDDIYVRKDVYESDQRAIISEIQRGNAELLRVIERNNSELLLKLEQYRNESKADLEQFKGEVNSRFDKLESRVAAHEEKMEYLGTALNDRISDTHTYISWGFTILGVVVAIAVVLLPALKLFKAIKEVFKPSVTVEKIREIAREEIAKVLPQPRQ